MIREKKMREIRKRSRLLAVLLVILLASSAPINVSAAAAKRKAKLMYKVDVRRNNFKIFKLWIKIR